MLRARSESQSFEAFCSTQRKRIASLGAAATVRGKSRRDDRWSVEIRTADGTKHVELERAPLIRRNQMDEE